MATLNIEGMSCGHCTKSVTEALEKIDGISDVQVDLLAKQATFTESSQDAVEQAKAAITAIGFVVVN